MWNLKERLGHSSLTVVPQRKCIATDLDVRVPKVRGRTHPSSLRFTMRRKRLIFDGEHKSMSQSGSFFPKMISIVLRTSSRSPKALARTGAGLRVARGWMSGVARGTNADAVHANRPKRAAAFVIFLGSLYKFKDRRSSRAVGQIVLAWATSFTFNMQRFISKKDDYELPMAKSSASGSGWGQGEGPKMPKVRLHSGSFSRCPGHVQRFIGSSTPF